MVNKLVWAARLDSWKPGTAGRAQSDTSCHILTLDPSTLRRLASETKVNPF